MYRSITEKIKLVIWDLDDTFWAGTLSEGGGDAIEANIACLRTLVDRGIMNSISSKNDFDKAMKRLKEMGVAELFVFPHINWEGKGPQVADIIQACNLRPKNVLFIDDNARNLQEVSFHAAGLMTASPDVIPELLELPEAQGRPDPDHTRLAQFRVLERKSEARRAYSSNDEFLRRSDVRVNICTDCEAHVDRILELIDRTNQLNFTKDRIGKDALEQLLADPCARSMYVVVRDAFGDYGISGFVSLRGSECTHFLFSCRLIGLGVVEWVYAELGAPHLEVVGETAIPFPFASRPGWINQPSEEEPPAVRKIRKVGLSVLLRGGCDLLQMEQYLKFKRLVCEFNHRRFHRDHTAFALDSYRYRGDPRLAEICERVPFLWKNTFDTGIYDSSYDVVVFSLLINYIQAVYSYRSDPGLRLGYGAWMKPLSRENLGPFREGELDWFLDNFSAMDRMSAQELKEDLEFVRSHMHPDVHLVLINGCEVAHENPLEPGTLAVHIELNNAIDEFVAAHSSNTHLLDMRRIVTRREQLTNNIRHYQRDVYWRMAQELMRITSEIAELKAKRSRSALGLLRSESMGSSGGVAQRMANMALVCACVVALSHVGYDTAVGSAGWWFVRMTRCGICCLAVPFFFVVSGYFLSQHFVEPGWWRKETAKRLMSLVVPYLIWAVLFFVFARLGVSAMRLLAGKGFALSFPLAKLGHVFGVNLSAIPMLMPIWYMRALFLIVLLSPALALLGRWRWAVFAEVAFFALYVCFSPHRNGLPSTAAEHFLYYGLSLMGIVYFFAGVLFRKAGCLDRTLGVTPWAGVAALAAGILLLAWRVHCIAVSGGEPFPVLCLAIPLLVAGTWLVVPAKPWPKWLTSLSFPIYVMHFFVVFALDGFRAPRANKSIGFMLAEFAAAVAVPSVMALLLRRIFPRVAAFAFGGR